MVGWTLPNSMWESPSVRYTNNSIGENGKYTSTENFAMLAQSSTFCCIANVKNGEDKHKVMMY